HGAEPGEVDRKIGFFDGCDLDGDRLRGRGLLCGLRALLAAGFLPAKIADRADNCDQQTPTDGAGPGHVRSRLIGNKPSSVEAGSPDNKRYRVQSAEVNTRELEFS